MYPRITIVAISFGGLKMYNQAISDYTSAIQLKQDPGYYRNRAIAYQMLGRAADAKRDNETAQQLEVSR